MNWNEIDTIFKDGLYNHKVPFNESSWQKMESMLPSEKASKRIIYWPAAAIFSAISIGLAAIVFIAWPLSTHQYVERNETLFEEYAKQRKVAIDEMIREIILAEQMAENNKSTSVTIRQNNDEVLHVTNTSKTTVSGAQAQNNNLIASVSSKAHGLDFQLIEPSLFMGFKDEINLNTMNVGGDIIYLKEFKTPKARRKHSVGFVGGINFSKGFASGSQADNFGVNPYGGVFYQHYFSKRWSLYSAIQYQARNAIGTSKVISTTTNYNFGKELNTLRIQNRTLNYLELPILVNYRLSSAMHIVAGASLAYVVNGSSEIHHDFSNEFETWTKTERSFGHLEGVNRFDAAIQAGVEYEFTQKLAIGGLLHYGLVNVLDNAHFNKTLNDQNLMFRVSAKYHLFRF
jgi:hypothetical protein